MGSIFDEVRTLQQQATLDRKRGEALRKAGREPEAQQAFAPASPSSNWLGELESGQSQDHGSSSPSAGSREFQFSRRPAPTRQPGTMRLRERKYVEGAAVERGSIAKTYNRVNEIKYALLTGRESVAEVEARTRMTADRLLATLTDPATLQLGDDGPGRPGRLPWPDRGVD
jgi:hypothetical protein